MKNTMKPLVATALLAALLAHVHAQGLPPPPVSPTPVTEYEYDAEGNRTKITRGAGTLNLVTKLSYDPLYRVKDSTDPKLGVTQFEHDGGDRTTKVTDPRKLVTQSPRDGFGNATQLISPDTGTANQTWDEADNLITRIDSRGVLATSVYDVMNRRTGTVFTKTGVATQAFTWTYDQTGGVHGAGTDHLTGSSFPGGSTQHGFNLNGEMVTDLQLVDAASGANATAITKTVSYGQDVVGRVASITYPSGRKLGISYMSGRPNAITLAQDAGSMPRPLITQIKWLPFGPVENWQWAMAAGPLDHERVHDLSARIVRQRLGAVYRDIRYDEASRIVSFTHLNPDGTPQPALDQGFSYDENSRITGVTTATASWALSHDPNSNRTSVSLDGSLSLYNTEPTSNRLTSITNPARSFTYDTAGNTLTDSASYSATYDASGRLATLTKAGVTTTYTYNAFGQRVRKVSSTGPASTVIFVYGQQGELLGEYDQAGQVIREYAWLGSIPIAVFMPDPANPSGEPLVYFIHTDHLNTPRVVVDKNGVNRWTWFAEPFGTTAPTTNPNGLGDFTFNLRFPGQYADQESGLFYNYWRNYDSSKGGYTQSDPIGLAGGSLSTYVYVDGNPLIYTDPSGTIAVADDLLIGGAILATACALDSGCRQGVGNALTSVATAAGSAASAIANALAQCPPAPGGRDPCKGLRDQLADHERKLREYIANPMSMDNKGFLAGALAKNDQDLYNKIYMTRLVSLQGQIANFKKQLEECERRNGR
jgi:RHS repeat-associated protein